MPERVVEPGPELGAVPSGEIQCGGGKKWRGGGRHRNSRGGVGMESIRSRLGAGLG